MVDVQLSIEPLNPEICRETVSASAAGGVVVFVGTVRNHTQGRKVLKLEFEAYAPMAIKEMEKIAHQVIEQFGVLHVSIHHRVGTLAIGEIPVVIAVSAPHRKAAFDGCEYAIDTLKQTVPIWKKEIFTDGEVWVSAHP